MQCPQCQHENPAGQKFCGECGGRLALVCPACHAVSPPTKKFCGECGAKLTGDGAPAPAGGPSRRRRPVGSRRGSTGTQVPQRRRSLRSPEAYTPKHLAEKILTSRMRSTGERKQVTVVFTDVSGFTAMSERLDPEDVHAIMDRAFEVILAAVHRLRGHRSTSSSATA